MKKMVLFGSILLASCGQQTQPVYEPVEIALSVGQSSQSGVVSVSMLADTGFYSPIGVTIKVFNGTEELKTIDPAQPSASMRFQTTTGRTASTRH